jgi:putative hemolysin
VPSLLEIVLLFSLIVFNGLLAMSEVALLTSKRAKLTALAAKGKKSAQIALKISEDPTQFLSAIQIGITSIGLLSGIVGEAVFAKPLAVWLQSLGVPEAAAGIGATVAVVLIVTFVAITIGELVPKRIGQSSPEAISAVVARPMNLLTAATKPFVVILSVTTNALLRLFGIGKHKTESVTEEEIQAILEEGAVAGLIEDQERLLVKNVFRLDDRKVGSLMVPRSDITFVDKNAPREKTLEQISKTLHSRIPVCDADLDSIIGVLRTKQALASLAMGEKFDIEAHLEPPLHVPETLTGMDLLKKFKESRTHMAFVVDEYGSLEGLVTLQDIFDSLIGEISVDSETDSSPVQRSDGSWLLEGDTSIHDLQDCLGVVEFPGQAKARFHTVSGLVLLLLGKMPVVGDSVFIDGWQLEVVDLDGHRIDKILASPVVDKLQL